jgi:hypothetical protein
MSECDIAAIQCADYTLGTRQNRKGPVLVSSFGGDGAGGGADEEPLCGARDAAQDAAAAGDAQGVVAFAGECNGLLVLVGEVGLGSSEPGLAGFAIDGEVVERFQVFGGNDGVGFWRGRTWRSWSGLQNDWGWQRKLGRQVVDNLCWRDDGALLGGESGEGLRELGVAVVLASVGGGEKLLGRGELGFELGAIAAVGSPGKKDG